MSDRIECRSYTRARRHPKVLGRIGDTVLPFTVTMPQLLVGGIVLSVVLATRAVWSPILPGALVVPSTTIGSALATRYVRVEGRNPLYAAAGYLLLWLAAANGVSAGRAVPRRRPRRVSTTVAVYDTEPIEASAGEASTPAATPTVAAVPAGAVRWQCLETP